MKLCPLLPLDLRKPRSPSLRGQLHLLGRQGLVPATAETIGAMLSGCYVDAAAERTKNT